MEYIQIDGYPNTELFEEVLHLHESIFKESESLLSKAKTKPRLLFTLAVDDGKVLGYKIGYELDSQNFYSWLGGVDGSCRQQGIASELMEQQHDYLVTKGYKTVQTKTKNIWRNTLILNLKNGFDVIGTYTDDVGEPKIILVKKLR
ncbi:GNAT family N-acetyltransferase [Sporosarcina sp.]|uniref:GNAT family N-acetyltransferase n=1 Tax=Sporosarcina sp. TaxID=49982 RepID=UPI002601B6DA|nr:GNAT family N-acetyltransferase [Sporosarcina sp.]